MSATRLSPNERTQQMLQTAVLAGTVKSADQSALSGALDDVDTAMKNGASAGTMEPGGMKTKIDGLIDQEVSNGKLTDDQATELKQVFAQAAQKMGGAHHHGGPKGPPPSDDLTSTDDSTDTTTISTSTDSTKNAIDTLISFLKQMEDKMSSSTNYTSQGTSSGSGLSSLLVDSNA